MNIKIIAVVEGGVLQGVYVDRNSFKNITFDFCPLDIDNLNAIEEEGVNINNEGEYCDYMRYKKAIVDENMVQIW